IHLTSPAKAQEARITGTFQDTTFAAFIHAVEQQTQLDVFYDPQSLDTLQVDLVAQNRPLRAVFKELFEGTKFNVYFFDNNVFILYDVVIQTELPANFLSTDEKQEEAEENILIDFGYGLQASGNAGGSREIISIGAKSNKIKSGNARISGRVTHQLTGEPVVGASVFIKDPLIGSFTGADGAYELVLPKGKQELHITSVGMRSKTYDIILYSDGQLNLSLEESTTSLSEVVVAAARDENIMGARLGVEKLTLKDLKLVSTALGEADIVRAMLTLPGVKSVGEASNGFNVRGGATDQNLILYNESTVYNPSHLFGFFSAFNSDVIKDAELFKSSIPTRYDGRLSSVLQVNSKEGDRENLSAKGGIGPVTGRLMVEGPIIEDRTSFLVGVRANYSNWILNTLDNTDYRNSKGAFYDVNAELSHALNENNSVRAYGYQSHDQFRLRQDTLYQYSNRLLSVKWRHRFNQSFYVDASVGISDYNYEVSSESNPVNAFGLQFGISQLDLKSDFNYFTPSGHSLNFGMSRIQYDLKSGALTPRGGESLITTEILPDEQATETSAYLSDNFDVGAKLNLHLGVRYTHFRNIGPKDYFVYASETPKSSSTVIDTVATGKGDLIRAYNRPAYRAALRYTLTDHASVKFGWNTMNQFIHRISNTVAVSPTDIWKLSDFNIAPQSGSQLTIGYFKNSKSGVFETSVEVYYKSFRNFLDYKSRATLIMNPILEADVIRTKGRAYGVELLVKKTVGKLNGWIGYTYSRSEIRQDDPFAGETINEGRWQCS
ncbi:MAG: TonB-dependent receptor, partial [Bacteroidota bacterium]